jgi:fermentation-respiration switch protein FrsA (DUF1100 family)
MKALMRLIGLALVLYGAAAGYLYLKQRDLLFVRDAQPAPLTGFWLHDHNVSDAWIDRLNPGHLAAMIYFPGNTTSGWDDPRRLARVLPHHTIYFMRYRGYANSPGAPSQRLLYADALALYDAIKADHQTIDIVGRSLGSSMAVYLAAKRTARKLLLVTPFDSIVLAAAKAYPWLPVTYLLKDPFPSRIYAPHVSETTRIILAQNDQTVPYQSSKRLIELFLDPPEVIAFRGVSHSGIIRHPLYLKTIAEFLEP